VHAQRNMVRLAWVWGCAAMLACVPRVSAGWVAGPPPYAVVTVTYHGCNPPTATATGWDPDTYTDAKTYTWTFPSSTPCSVTVGHVFGNQYEVFVTVYDGGPAYDSPVILPPIPVTVTDCDDHNLCTDDSCDPETGECVNTPRDCDGDDIPDCSEPCAAEIRTGISALCVGGALTVVTLYGDGPPGTTMRFTASAQVTAWRDEARTTPCPCEWTPDCYPAEVTVYVEGTAGGSGTLTLTVGTCGDTRDVTVQDLRIEPDMEFVCQGNCVQFNVVSGGVTPAELQWEIVAYGHGCISESGRLCTCQYTETNLEDSVITVRATDPRTGCSAEASVNFIAFHRGTEYLAPMPSWGDYVAPPSTTFTVESQQNDPGGGDQRDSGWFKVGLRYQQVYPSQDHCQGECRMRYQMHLTGTIKPTFPR